MAPSAHRHASRCRRPALLLLGLIAARSLDLLLHRARKRAHALDVPARSCGGLNDALQVLVSAGRALLDPSEALRRG